MSERTQMYDWFARMLSYPTVYSNFEIQHSVFDIHHFEISNNEYRMRNVEDYLQKFITEISNLSITDLEELYTRTFDINPIASLEIGWHLYGEAYERGLFLVKMRELLRQHHVEESSELPDHLTHVLMVLGRMEKAHADEFAAKFVIPALNKILEGFQGNNQPYEHALVALKSFIEQQHLSNQLDCKQGVESHV